LIRIFFRYLFRILLSILLLIGLWFLLALLLPYIPAGNNSGNEKKEIPVFISSNGIHTDFVMPVHRPEFDWSSKLPYSDFELAGPDHQYVSIGWGDRGFFIATPTWDDLTFSTAFNAAFGLSTSAMHVTYRKNELKENENCVRLMLSQKQYFTLIEYISNSFQQKEGRFVVIDHPGYNLHDKFYEAKGRYTLFNTCNVWTGRGLRAMGAPAGFWTPLPGGVMQNLK
jgi:uncharacterized protein (TIGR02117 family)